MILCRLGIHPWRTHADLRGWKKGTGSETSPPDALDWHGTVCAWCLKPSRDFRRYTASLTPPKEGER